MGKIAFLFPGQGSQSVGMGQDLYQNYEIAKAIFNQADLILNKNISQICFQGPDEALKQTVNTQPCIVTNSTAILETLKSQINIKPDFVAGHSLGEYCAMYCANVLSLEDTLKAIQKRADLMSQVNGGAMTAVIGASQEQLDTALKEASKTGYIDIANYNSPVQIVLTGDENALKIAENNLSQNGVRRIIPLAVSGAFHSKYMQNASKEFEKFVQTLDIQDAQIPVITNVDAQITLKSKDFQDKMPKQIRSSVYWTQTIQNMVQNGVNTFIEIGSGTVLAGLNKKIAPNTKTYNIFDKNSLTETIKILKGE